jgi:hypothetical protein
VAEGKQMLQRVVAMLTKLIQRFDGNSSSSSASAFQSVFEDEEEDEDEDELQRNNTSQRKLEPLITPACP